MTEHLNAVAAIVGEWLNPDAVLLAVECRPGVLAALLVGPRDALLTRTKGEGTLATVTADHVRQGVGLRTEDRRVGAVLIAELRVDGDAVQLLVAVVVGGTRVAVGAGQVHVARDQTLTHAERVGQVAGLGNTTAGNHVRIDDLIRLRCRLVCCLLSDSSRSSLGLHHHSAGGCQRQHSTSGCDGLHAVVLKCESPRTETSTDGTSAQVCHELSPF